MSDYDVVECPLCKYYYMRHLGACPNCYPEQASNSTKGLYLALAYPDNLDGAIKAIETAQKGASRQRSKKVSYDGYTFDSQKEFERYLFLVDAQKSFEIANLEVHPKYTLLAKVPKYKQGKISYTADFAYFHDGRYIVEDVKGAYGNTQKNRELGIAGKAIITEVARLRHKLLIALLYMKYGDNFDFYIITDVSSKLAQTGV